jgi:hypothetical protein
MHEDVADKLNLIPPIAEQCQHKSGEYFATSDHTLITSQTVVCSIVSDPKRSMREWNFATSPDVNGVLTSSRPLYKKYSIGTTVWSPLASGLLSGKVCNGSFQQLQIMSLKLILIMF